MDGVDDLLLVQGLEPRSLLVLLLLERSRPMSVSELAAAVRQAGFAVAGRPSKGIADALRWELRRGRVVRLQRGAYAAGYVAGVTRHRMRARVAEMRNACRSKAEDTQVPVSSAEAQPSGFTNVP